MNEPVPNYFERAQFASKIQRDSRKMGEESPVQNTVVEEVVPEATVGQETTTNSEPVPEEVTPKVEAVEDSRSQQVTEEVVPEVTNAVQDVIIEEAKPVAELVEESKSREVVSEVTSIIQDTIPEENEAEKVEEAVTVTTTDEQEPTSAATLGLPDVTQVKHSDGLPQYLHDAVSKTATQEGFTPGQFQVRFEVGSGKGDGFVAEMFRAHITEGDRELVVLCKIPPINDARRQRFGSMDIFDREALAYSKFLPAIYEFQREKGVTEESGIGFFNAPKCYMTHFDEAKQESVIIMDDLRLKDYRMWNKYNPVNYEHAKLVMEKLGKLHAVSFAMKEQRPEVFEQFKVPDMMSVMLKTNEGFGQMVYMSLDRAVGVLEVHEEPARQKLLKLRETMLDDVATIASAEYAEPYTVLGHGDCWVNNFMYSYKRGAPSEMILLDWQICRYVSPALDILYFIFNCTDENFRRQYFDEMIRIYHASLTKLLEKLGGDAQRQFPFTALLRQLKACGRFNLVMAIFAVPMMCVNNEDLPDFDAEAEKYKESQKVDMSFVVNEKAEAKYRKRMGGVIRDVIRYGYL